MLTLPYDAVPSTLLAQRGAVRSIWCRSFRTVCRRLSTPRAPRRPMWMASKAASPDYIDIRTGGHSSLDYKPWMPIAVRRPQLRGGPRAEHVVLPGGSARPGDSASGTRRSRSSTGARVLECARAQRRRAGRPGTSPRSPPTRRTTASSHLSRSRGSQPRISGRRDRGARDDGVDRCRHMGIDEPPVHERLLSVLVLLALVGSLVGMPLFFVIAGAFTPRIARPEGPGPVPHRSCGAAWYTDGVLRAGAEPDRGVRRSGQRGLGLGVPGLCGARLVVAGTGSYVVPGRPAALLGGVRR